MSLEGGGGGGVGGVVCVCVCVCVCVGGGGGGGGGDIPLVWEILRPKINNELAPKCQFFVFSFKPHFLFISTEKNTTRWHLRIWLVNHYTRRASIHQADGRHMTAKSRSHEIGCYNDRIAVKFDRHYRSAAFQNSERLEKFKPKSRGFELHGIFPNT